MEKKRITNTLRNKGSKSVIRRVLKAASCLLLALFLMATNFIGISPMIKVKAEEEPEIKYDLWVGGVQVTSKNTSGPGWRYEGGVDEGTLTLENANITTGYDDSFMNSNIRFGKFDYSSWKKIHIFNLTVNLIGSNTLNGAECGFYGDGNLTINGNGELIVESERYAIACDNLVMDGITADLKGNDAVVSLGEDMIIRGGSIVNIQGKGDFYGIYVLKGNFIIDGSKLNINYDGYGIFANKGEVKNKSRIDITVGNSMGSIFCNYGLIIDETSTITSNYQVGSRKKIVFDSNGRSGSMNSQWVESGKSSTLAENIFTSETEEFIGWSTSVDGNVVYKDQDSITVTDDTILYAQWTPKSYSVHFDSNGGSGLMNDMNRLINDNRPLTANTYVKEGYTFTGWNTSSDGKGISYREGATDNLSDKHGDILNLYAQWTPNKYNVSFDANGGSGNMEDMLNREYDDNISLTANTFTFDEHTFSGWNTQADGNGTSYANESYDNITSEDGITVTLYAQWDAVFYDIKTSDDGNGSASASATSGIKGTNISLTAKPNEGYKFAGWEIVSGEATINDASSATTTLLIGTSDVEVKATFEEIPEEPEITEPEPQPGSEEPIEPETPEEPAPEPEPEVEIPEKDWLDDFRLALSIAAELGGAQTVEYSGDFALSYEIMNYLVEHSSITLIYHVTYQGVEYTITIPAGKAISYSEIEWYGPLWLLANYGNGNVPTGAKGNGTYVVKAGDTLTGISVKLGVTIQYLVDKNNIKNANVITVGQLIEY